MSPGGAGRILTSTGPLPTTGGYDWKSADRVLVFLERSTDMDRQLEPEAAIDQVIDLLSL